MSNIRSLNDLTEKSNDRNKINSFVGGGESGLAIENPPDDTYWNKGIMQASTSHKVILYKNGFCVDGGPFRPDNVPENQEFMKDLQAGFAPPELIDTSDAKSSIRIAFEDRSFETFNTKSDNCTVFCGEGKTLTENRKSFAKDPVDVTRGIADVCIDNQKPITTLQIRFHNGEKVTQQFNEDQTIEDLHRFLMKVAPVNGDYRIVVGFPPKEVTASRNTTLKDAGLLHALITQKLC